LPASLRSGTLPTRPAAADFYTFTKTLETYKDTLGRDSTLILTTDSDLFRLLKQVEPK